ncbi:helix-turn-helix domain-containing protein [Rhodocaloribacter sp.]
MFDVLFPGYDEEIRDRLHVHPFIADVLRVYQVGLSLPDPAWPRDVQALVSYIHEHLFEENLCVKTIKQGCAVGDRMASARFRLHVGQHITSYFSFHRVEAAKRLLRYEALSITQVALAVGYAHPQTLTMAFRRMTGTTPSACRAQGKKTYL